MSDTIAAVATPSGRGGVGIIRVSGPDAAKLGLQITGRNQLSPRVADFARFYNSDNSVVDSGLIIFFPNPNSFTGEDVLELHAHGSPVVLDMLMKRIVSLGARVARPGEFSERAFLNDKIDLVQAEAIADLIASGTEQAATAAQRSLQGEFSSLIDKMIKKLIHLRMYVEAALDFPDEDVDFISDNKVQQQLDEMLESLFAIEKQAEQGVLLSEGINVAIIGKPNVGKSTLLNTLVGEDHAIVTPIAGTTRDTVKSNFQVGGLQINITDTAGLRHTDDVVELAGIEKAKAEIASTDLVLLVVDASQKQTIDYLHEYPEVGGKNFILVYNKTDLTSFSPGLNEQSDHVAVNISAATGVGVDELRLTIKNSVGHITDASNFIARRRHLTAVAFAREHVVQAISGISRNYSGEMIAEELRLAQQYLQEVTGAFTPDDLLGKIFSEFCIGK